MHCCWNWLAFERQFSIAQRSIQGWRCEVLVHNYFMLKFKFSIPELHLITFLIWRIQHLSLADSSPTFPSDSEWRLLNTNPGIKGNRNWLPLTFCTNQILVLWSSLSFIFFITNNLQGFVATSCFDHHVRSGLSTPEKRLVSVRPRPGARERSVQSEGRNAGLLRTANSH